jgi:hypothetical protein
LPLVQKSSSITDVFGAQIGEGDGILSFNMNKDVTEGSLFNSGSWAAFPGVPAITDVTIGKAYGFISANTKYVSVVGKVLDADSAAVPLAGGWDNTANQAAVANFIGTSYPLPTAIADSGLTSATTQGTDPTNAGTVYEFNANADLINGTNSMAVNTASGWVDGTFSTPATLKLIPGRGYMLNEPVKTTFNWAQPKSY